MRQDAQLHHGKRPSLATDALLGEQLGELRARAASRREHPTAPLTSMARSTASTMSTEWTAWASWSNSPVR
jgi:H+/Cl- antiporter ClcA